MEPRFRYRDSWPECPSCGEDEMVSSRYAFAGVRGVVPPLLSEYYKHPFRCQECAWEGEVPYPQPYERDR